MKTTTTMKTKTTKTITTKKLNKRMMLCFKCRMIFRSLPERLSEAEIDEMLEAADTDGEL